jgi:P pilus assembly chaperone PapD
MDEILKPVLSLILLLFSFPGYSGVVMTGTRIIYPLIKGDYYFIKKYQ